MSAIVRALEISDWPQLWPLLDGMGTHATEPQIAEGFSHLLADPRWLLLGGEVLGGGLVGYAGAQDYGPHLRAGFVDRTARLHDLFVAEEFRRQGVARALMDEVVRWAGENVRYLQWQAHETSAVPFYEQLGYRGEPCPQPDYPSFEITFDR